MNKMGMAYNRNQFRLRYSVIFPMTMTLVTTDIGAFVTSLFLPQYGRGPDTCLLPSP